MGNQEIRDVVRKELPGLLHQDPDVREGVLGLTRERYADKRDTQDRFDRVLDELRREREAETLRWQEQKAEDRRRWDEQAALWAEQKALWAEQKALWAEQKAEDRRKWDEDAARWRENAAQWAEQKAEDRRRWDEDAARWRENAAQINRMLDSIEALARKHDSTLGALGARWGMHSEESFRNGLRAILQGSFGVEVTTVTEYDEDGDVFGRPDQVELDLIVKDGILIVCEIKSSMSKADMHIFDRKLRFYEKRHDRPVSRALVISPMVDPRARRLAQQLGLEVYSYAEDVAAAPPAAGGL